MKKSVIAYIFIFSIAVISLFISGCERREAKKPSPPEKITLGITNELTGALVYIAYEKGYFKEEGLDISPKQYPSGKRALEAMFAGEVDVSTPAETPVMLYAFERQDFSIIAMIGASDREVKIIARKNRGINKPSDLRGKRIATQKGSAVHYFLSTYLLYNKILETDVKIIYLKAEEIAPALIKGSVDAISMRDPFTKQAQDALRDNAKVFEAHNIYQKTFNIVSTKGFIKNKPETTKKILRAVLKAERFIHGNRAESIEITAKETNLEKDYMVSVWDIYRFEVSLEQSLLVSLEEQARWAIKNKLTDKKKVPNYLDFIYQDGLKAVKPEAVTIIK